MSELKQLLESHLSALVDIQALLACEMKCLVEGDEKDVSRLTTDKQRLMGKLTESAQGLDMVLAREGVTADSDGLARYFERARDADELSSLRDKVSEGLRVCADLNRANGAVLEAKRAAAERALRVLLSSHRDSSLYRATGRLETVGSRQSIGSA